VTTAILAAEKWLNDGPLPTRRRWRRRAGAAVLATGLAVMLGSGASPLWHWATSRTALAAT